MIPRLIAGPYAPPRDRRYRPGRTVDDLIRGEVECRGYSAAPIAWPVARTSHRARPTPVVIGDLARAIRTESVEAIVYYWGVSRYTVRRWRIALKVDRFNAGTLTLWREYVAAKLHRPEIKRRARAGSERYLARVRAGRTD